MQIDNVQVQCSICWEDFKVSVVKGQQPHICSAERGDDHWLCATCLPRILGYPTPDESRFKEVDGCVAMPCPVTCSAAAHHVYLSSCDGLIKLNDLAVVAKPLADAVKAFRLRCQELSGQDVAEKTRKAEAFSLVSEDQRDLANLKLNWNATLDQAVAMAEKPRCPTCGFYGMLDTDTGLGFGCAAMVCQNERCQSACLSSSPAPSYLLHRSCAPPQLSNKSGCS